MGVLPAKAQKNRYLSAKHCSNRAPATRIPLGTWVSTRPGIAGHDRERPTETSPLHAAGAAETEAAEPGKPPCPPGWCLRMQYGYLHAARTPTGTLMQDRGGYTTHSMRDAGLPGVAVRGGASFEWGWGGLRARWSELRARRGEPRGQRNALTWWPFHLRAGSAELRWSGTGLRRPCAGLRAWVGLLPWSCAFLLCSAGSLLCFVAAVLCFEGSLAGFRAAGPSFVPAPGPFVSEAACLLPEGHCHSRRPALSWTTPAARTPATRIKNHPPRRRN